METTLPMLIDLFTTTKQTEGLSPRTIGWYREKLTDFALFLGETARIADVTLDKAREFIAGLQSRTQRFTNHPCRKPAEGGLSPYTIHGYVRALKAFASWMADEERTPRNVLQKLTPPKLPQTQLKVLRARDKVCL